MVTDSVGEIILQTSKLCLYCLFLKLQKCYGVCKLLIQEGINAISNQSHTRGLHRPMFGIIGKTIEITA